MLRNLAQNLIEHGQISTTLPKAKTLRPYVEKLVTLAVRTHKRSLADDGMGALRARRRLHRLLGDRSIIPREHHDDYIAMSDAGRARTLRMVSGRRYRTGEPKGRLAFTAESVTHRLIETIAPRYVDRPGGYTRLIRLAKPRLGDCSSQAVVQFVGGEEAPLSLTKPGKSARKRRTDARYALAIKAAKGRGGKGKSAKPKQEEQDAATAQDGDQPSVDTDQPAGDGS